MSGSALAVNNAKKLGFSHRTEPELEQLLAEGMDPHFWYLWTDMGFSSDEDEDRKDELNCWMNRWSDSGHDFSKESDPWSEGDDCDFGDFERRWRNLSEHPYEEYEDGDLQDE